MLVKETRSKSFIKWLMGSPARVIILSFLAIILVGTILLSLPIAVQPGRYFTIFDALFTAVSATCVTGLIVTDTATTFTAFGKVVIIILIQIGGLGLMTITSFFFSLARKKVDLKARMLAQESAGSFNFTEIPRLLKFIIGITVSIEIIGGLVLSLEYVPKFGIADGFSKAFFQSISAFCNAGFDILGDTEAGAYSSLIGMNDNPLVLITTALLIIFGGLGFIVWADMANIIRGKNNRIKTHSKIVIKITLVLLALGFLFFLILEWNNPSFGQTASQKMLSAFFQSSSLRTAGFTSVNLTGLTDTSKVLSAIFMLIGAGSGSTGGGIKVTTFAVIIFSVWSELRGKSETIAEKSHIVQPIINKALAIFFSGIAIVTVLTLTLTLTEHVAISAGRISTVDLFYEAASAFATVGLSTADTPQLTSIGQLCIIPAMFLGRVGPVTMALSMAMKERKNAGAVYPDAKIHIG